MKNLIKTRPLILFTAVALGSLILQGCSTPGIGGSDYTYSEVRGEQSVRIGTVESIRRVKIQAGEPGLVGTIGGAVAGAALGHTVGEGNGSIAATLLGTLAGGAAGQALEGVGSEKEGVELTVRLDNGYVIAVTQGLDEEFRVGDRVQVLGGAGATRVTRLDPASSLNYSRPMGPAGAGGAPASVPPRNAPPPPMEGAAPPSGATAPSPEHLLYYCPDSNAYYPAVGNCKSPWMRVVK